MVSHTPSAGCRDVAQLGSASALGAEGRRFKSCHPDQMGLDLLRFSPIVVPSDTAGEPAQRSVTLRFEEVVMSCRPTPAPGAWQALIDERCVSLETQKPQPTHHPVLSAGHHEPGQRQQQLPRLANIRVRSRHPAAELTTTLWLADIRRRAPLEANGSRIMLRRRGTASGAEGELGRHVHAHLGRAFRSHHFAPDGSESDSLCHARPRARDPRA